MKIVLELIVLCICFGMLAGSLGELAGVSFSSKRAEYVKDEAKENLSNLRSDTNIVVSDWYRKGYFAYYGDWKWYTVANIISYKMAALHGLLWILMSIYITNRWEEYQKRQVHSGWGLATHWGFLVLTYFSGFVVLSFLSVIFWLIAGILISIFWPDSSIPLEFVVFLTLLGFYAAVAAYLAALAVGRIGRRREKSSAEPSRAIARRVGVPEPFVRGRIVRAMLKSLFVAMASAIGGKVGGWIGGVLVFAISAGVSAYFELPSPDADHSQHHQPQHS